ncbi:MAG: hypothetical protein KDD82_15035 [Planctomycetes bacterium]|nr:hypothetical protein [Planctomycetota bacterium]
MRVRLLATWCVVVGLLGVAGGGCGPSTSGGGGRPFTGGGPTGAPNSAGGAQRDPLGYSFGLAQVSSVSGGTVTALAAVPGTTADSLAAHAPLQQVNRLVQGQPGALETTFAGSAVDLVELGNAVFAATGNRALNGVGDVFRRVEPTPGAPTWSPVLDTNDREATVAALTSGNQLVAATGGEGGAGTLWTLDGTSLAIVSSLSLGAQVPTASLEFPAGSGDVYVGTTSNATGGSAAGLLRVSGGAIQSLNLPSAGAQAGVREQVTALVRTPSATGVDQLAVAVARVSLASGAPLGGAVYVTDGASFTLVATLATNDAPTALASTDNTLYVGTALGQLLYLDGGAIQTEPGLPALTRIDSLLVRDAKTLVIGGQNTAGAVAVTRTGNTP